LLFEQPQSTTDWTYNYADDANLNQQLASIAAKTGQRTPPNGTDIFAAQ
jgi:hypothetical protein